MQHAAEDSAYALLLLVTIGNERLAALPEVIKKMNDWLLQNTERGLLKATEVEHLEKLCFLRLDS